MDIPSESLLAQVHPELARRVRNTSDALMVEGILLRVTQGLRTMEQQAFLWAKGRDVASGKIINPTAVVTKARPGYSYHNFGLAVDVAPDVDGRLPFTPDWNIKHPSWQRIIAVAHTQGLTTGATWRTFPDFPHLQLTGPFPEAAPSPELRLRLNASGGNLQPIWNAVSHYVGNALR